MENVRIAILSFKFLHENNILNANHKKDNQKLNNKFWFQLI